jgi:hypothetical protein
MPPGPTFIFSFDCEGKWGMADHLLPEHRRISDSALAEAYARLAELLDSRRVPATFAFVSALVAGRERTMAFLESVRPVNPRYVAWIAQLRTAIAGSPGGWFAPDLAPTVLRHGINEFASHGGTHAPLTAAACAAADFQAEMEFVRATESALGQHSETLVFPRNQEGHHAGLAGFGFKGYRRAHPLETGRSPAFRLLRLAAEWLPQPGVAHAASAGMIAIPAGSVLNFAHGPRRHIPRRVTTLRARGSMIDSVLRNRVSHYYSHPHNFITDPGLFAVLQKVIDQAAELRERGKISIETQAGYLRSLSRASSA